MMSLGSLWTQPVLPPSALLPWGVALSWGVCIAALLWMAARAWGQPSLRWLAGAVWLSACGAALWPDVIDWPAQWALAFQTPSAVTLIGLCVWAWRSAQSHTRAQTPIPAVWVWATWGLGWALWFDTFNRWPEGWDVSLYNWGFGATALWVGAGGLLLSTLRAWRRTATLASVHGVVAAALLLFALTRWPTGNVWDAVLDPWLWLLSHVYVLRHVWCRVSDYWRTSKYSRQNSSDSGD